MFKVSQITADHARFGQLRIYHSIHGCYYSLEDIVNYLMIENDFVGEAILNSEAFRTLPGVVRNVLMYGGNQDDPAIDIIGVCEFLKVSTRPWTDKRDYLEFIQEMTAKLLNEKDEDKRYMKPEKDQE